MKLKNRFILAAGVISALFMAVIVYDRVTGVREAMLLRTQDKAEYIASSIADLSSEYLQRGDPARLRQILPAFKHFRQVAYLRVTDASGRVVYARAAQGVSLEGHEPDDSAFLPGDGIFDLRREIMLDGARYGLVELGMSLEGIGDAVSALMWRGVVIGLVFIACTLLLVWAITLQLGREMGMLFELSEHIQSEKLPEVGKFSPGSDTGQVAGSLRALHAGLAEAQRLRGQAETQKDDFFAMTVHDLKQPVTSLKASLDLLLEEEEAKSFTEEQKRNLAQIARTSLGMLSAMIADVLNLAKLNSAGYQPEKERLKLSDFLRQCAQEQALAVRAAGRKWELDIPEEAAGAWIFADPELIRRVIGNLVQNAVQYTPEGGMVKLGVKLRDGGKAALYVSDEGEGIPEEFREEIFKKYSTLGKDYKNIGLGLAFCKMVAERHSAVMDVVSEPGRGTEISLVLPVSRQAVK